MNIVKIISIETLTVFIAHKHEDRDTNREDNHHNYSHKNYHQNGFVTDRRLRGWPDMYASVRAVNQSLEIFLFALNSNCNQL